MPCKTCNSKFRRSIELKFKNGIPAQLISAWLLENRGERISHSSILNHMRKHTEFGPPTDAERVEEERERGLYDKYLRDGATHEEIAAGQEAEALVAETAATNAQKAATALKIVEQHNTMIYAYQAALVEDQKRFTEDYWNGMAQEEHKRNGGEKVNELEKWFRAQSEQ